MNKTLVIAKREYRAAVRSKAFVIGLVAVPVLMVGAIALQLVLKDKVDTATKKIAVVDRSGKLKPALEAAVTIYNEREVYDNESDQPKQIKPKFALEFIDSESLGEPPESTLALSERVRNNELDAFLEIGSEAAELSGTGENNTITYHSENPVADDFRNWSNRVLSLEIQKLRALEAGVEQDALQRITQPVFVQNLGLAERDVSTGEISKPDETNILAHIFVPMGMMMLIFMAVMVGATPLVQAVQEEKQARISEVLLGSAKPFELMFGKLIGTVGVSITTVTIYLIGGFVVLKATGYDQYFPSVDVIIWLFVFQSLAVLMYGALFIAVGAAVTDMREAQSMMMPVMICAMSPMFVWLQVVKEPTSAFATSLSLFPPATPMLMLLRVAAPQAIPIWQPILGVALVLISTLACVYVAARIFRVGILMQGKGATLGQMVSWVVRG